MLPETLHHVLLLLRLPRAKHFRHFLQQFVGREVSGPHEDSPRQVSQRKGEVIVFAAGRPVVFENLGERAIDGCESLAVELVHTGDTLLGVGSAVVCVHTHPVEFAAAVQRGAKRG